MFTRQSLRDQYEARVETTQTMRQSFKQNGWFKLRHYPVRVSLAKLLLKLIPALHSRWLVKQQLFWGKDFYTQGYFMDYLLCGFIAESSEMKLTRFFLQYVKPDEIFFDVGTHYGFFSLLVEALVSPVGRVISFEPTPATYQVLEKNAVGTRVEPVPLALSDSGGQKTFAVFTDKNKSGSNSLHGEAGATVIQSHDFTTITVTTTTLDEYCTGHAVQPTLIKIDVEGAELEVIRGGLQTLDASKPTIIMEIWPAGHNTDHITAIQLVINYNYQPHLVDEQGQLQPVTVQQLAALAEIDNVVLIPDSHDYRH